MNLLFVIVKALILHHAIHFCHCTIVIEFDETTEVENMVNLEVNLTVSKAGISYCIQVFIERYDFTYLFGDSNEEHLFMQFLKYTPNGLDLHQWHYGMEYFLRSNFTTDGNGKVEPFVKSHEWTTICTSVSETLIYIAVNGLLLGNLTRRAKEESNQTHISSLYFGSFKDRKRGKVTNLFVWPVSLSTEKILEYSNNCIINFQENNSLLNWNRLNVTDFSGMNNSNVRIKDVPPEERCQNVSIIEFLNEEMTFPSAIRICDELGGRLFQPNSESDLTFTLLTLLSY